MSWAKVLVVGALIIAAVMAIATAITVVAPYIAGVIVIYIIYIMIDEEEK